MGSDVVDPAVDQRQEVLDAPAGQLVKGDARALAG